MGGNYEKSIYNQLMDVMARLDVVFRIDCKYGNLGSLIKP